MAELEEQTERLRALAHNAGVSSLLTSYPEGLLNVLIRNSGNPQVALQKLIDSEAR